MDTWDRMIALENYHKWLSRSRKQDKRLCAIERAKVYNFKAKKVRMKTKLKKVRIRMINFKVDGYQVNLSIKIYENGTIEVL